MFAKLFNTEVGQILVKIDSGDEGPEVRYFCEPEGFGVCSVALKFSDDDSGWDKAEKAFEKSDLGFSLDVVKASVLNVLNVETNPQPFAPIHCANGYRLLYPNDP